MPLVPGRPSIAAAAAASNIIGSEVVTGSDGLFDASSA